LAPYTIADFYVPILIIRDVRFIADSYR